MDLVKDGVHQEGCVEGLAEPLLAIVFTAADVQNEKGDVNRKERNVNKHENDEVDVEHDPVEGLPQKVPEEVPNALVVQTVDGEIPERARPKTEEGDSNQNAVDANVDAERRDGQRPLAFTRTQRHGFRDSNLFLETRTLKSNGKGWWFHRVMLFLLIFRSLQSIPKTVFNKTSPRDSSKITSKTR